MTIAAAREILQEPLSAVASRVDAVASGKEAIAAIQQHDATEPYDIVFMDWRMPGMDGLQASRHIKSDETLSHQPAIVLVTAFGREEVREEAERLQLDGFLVKPVTKSMIVDTLVNVFADSEEETSTAGGGRAGDAAPRRADSSDRGQRDQPADRRRTSRRRRRDGEGRQQRTRGGRDFVERPAAAAVRRRVDGPADAGDGRLPGHREASFRRALRHAADHRDDGARHDRGAPALPRRRHERPHLQAD